MNISSIRPIGTPALGGPAAPQLAAIREELANPFGFVGAAGCPWGKPDKPEPKPKPGQ